MLETARDQSSPYLQQISFFLANKVGSLERVVKALEEETVRICGMSILDAHDHAVVRLIVDLPGKAEQALSMRGHRICSTRVLGIAVGTEAGAVGNLLSSLLQAELNVFYAYALLARQGDRAILALHPDDVEVAANVLRSKGFELITQRDLESGDGAAS